MTATISHRFAAALSTERQIKSAMEQVTRQAMAELDRAPDLAFVFLSADHAGDAEWVAEQLGERLESPCVLGCTAESVIGTGQEIEQEPAVSLWLASLPGSTIWPMHLELEQTAEGPCVVGWHEELSEKWPEPSSLIMLGDPFSFPADSVLARLSDDRPSAAVMGGMASAATSPGENRLIVGQRVLDRGAVAVLLAGAVKLRPVVSQGCRPIGSHYVVTKAERNIIYELGGKPALLQLKEVFDSLPAREQRMVQQGLHVGRVVSEYQDRFEQGDFLVRNVMGIQPDDGSIVIADWVRPGQTVKFHIRDAETADTEMRELLAQASASGAACAGGLLFSCNGRGTRLFDQPHHDALAVQDALGPIPLAGFFAAGELGPVGGRNFVHGFTASLALFLAK